MEGDPDIPKSWIMIVPVCTELAVLTPQGFWKKLISWSTHPNINTEWPTTMLPKNTAFSAMTSSPKTWQKKVGKRTVFDQNSDMTESCDFGRNFQRPFAAKKTQPYSLLVGRIELQGMTHIWNYKPFKFQSSLFFFGFECVFGMQKGFHWADMFFVAVFLWWLRWFLQKAIQLHEIFWFGVGLTICHPSQSS